MADGPAARSLGGDRLGADRRAVRSAGDAQPVARGGAVQIGAVPSSCPRGRKSAAQAHRPGGTDDRSVHRHHRAVRRTAEGLARIRRRGAGAVSHRRRRGGAQHRRDRARPRTPSRRPRPVHARPGCWPGARTAGAWPRTRAHPSTRPEGGGHVMPRIIESTRPGWWCSHPRRSDERHSAPGQVGRARHVSAAGDAPPQLRRSGRVGREQLGQADRPQMAAMQHRQQRGQRPDRLPPVLVHEDDRAGPQVGLDVLDDLGPVGPSESRESIDHMMSRRPRWLATRLTDGSCAP